MNFFMNEYCIIFPKYDNDIFLYFWKKFEAITNKYKHITIKNDDDSIGLSFATKRNSKNALDNIKQILAESIVLHYKYKFMATNLKLPEGFEKYQEALCKSLAVFDKGSDVLEVTAQMHLTASINVDSFYFFKLAGLREKWEEIINLFIENMAGLLCSNSFVELIRYLIMTTENNGLEVFIYKFNETIYIRNKDGNNLSDPIVVKENYLPEVVSELILLAPMNIYIKYDSPLASELTEIIIDLFAEKVVVNT